MAQRIDDDAYGRVLQNTNPGFQPFGYAGWLLDEATRLVRLGARDYDAETGRWAAKDPAGIVAAGTNLYAYVSDAPVSRVDPQGLWSMPATPDWVVNAAAGFGDGISFGLTRQFRVNHGYDDAVNGSSALYKGAKIAGNGVDMALLWSLGLSGGSNSVFWSGGTPAMNIAGELGTTLSQTPIGGAMNWWEYEQQISQLPDWLWKAASATFAANADGSATAVILSSSTTSIWSTVELPILTLRGIPISFF